MFSTISGEGNQEAVNPNLDQPYSQKEQLNSNLANLDQKTGNGCTPDEERISDYNKKSLLLVDLPKSADAYPRQDEMPVSSNLPSSTKEFATFDDQYDHDPVDIQDSEPSSWEVNTNAHQQGRQNIATQHSYQSASFSSVQGISKQRLMMILKVIHLWWILQRKNSLTDTIVSATTVIKNTSASCLHDDDLNHKFIKYLSYFQRVSNLLTISFLYFYLNT